MADPAEGFAEYARFIDEQVSEQEATLVIFERRASAVVTGAAALVTLLSGFLALRVDRDGSIDLSCGAAAVIGLALILFVLTAIAALLVSVPRGVRRASPGSLTQFVQKHWDDEPKVALKEIAETQIETLQDLRLTNGKRATLLTVAVGFEVGAITATAIAAWIIST